ncbi:MAG: hypothetical protein RH860_01295 [Cytophagales bacterium]
MSNSEFKSKNHKNTVNLAIWTFSWCITTAIATFGPILIWDSNVLSILGVIVCTLAGVGMLLANMSYLNGLDELQRKIHMEAMAWALGVAVVGGLSYALTDKIDLISHDADIAVVVVMISITYLIAVIAGSRRYN